LVREINKGPKINFEKKTLKAMIDLYYKKHPEQNFEKEDTLNYAMDRLSFCRFGEEKPTCKVCPIHCYKKSYKERMQIIMRYAGPRMLFYHPVMSIEHLLKERQYKKM